MPSIYDKPPGDDASRKLREKPKIKAALVADNNFVMPFGRIVFDPETKEPRWIVPIESIFPDSTNANIHPDNQLQLLERNLRRFGQKKPVVIRPDKMIVAGNGTYEAACKLSEKGFFLYDDGGEVWVTMANDLSPTEAIAFGIADNQLAKLSIINRDILRTHLSSIEEEGALGLEEDIGLLGFADSELSEMGLRDLEDPEVSNEEEKSEEFKRFDGQEATAYKCPKCEFEWSGKAK